METCPDCHGPLRGSPDYVVGMDYAGSIYPTTVTCLACMVLWGCRDGGGLVSVLPAHEAASTFDPKNACGVGRVVEKIVNVTGPE